METLDPPPKIKDGKMARFFPSRAFILALGVGGGGGGGVGGGGGGGGGRMGFSVPFYSVQGCKIGKNKSKT